MQSKRSPRPPSPRSEGISVSPESLLRQMRDMKHFLDEIKKSELPKLSSEEIKWGFLLPERRTPQGYTQDEIEVIYVISRVMGDFIERVEHLDLNHSADADVFMKDYYAQLEKIIEMWMRRVEKGSEYVVELKKIDIETTGELYSGVQKFMHSFKHSVSEMFSLIKDKQLYGITRMLFQTAKALNLKSASVYYREAYIESLSMPIQSAVSSIMKTATGVIKEAFTHNPQLRRDELKHFLGDVQKQLRNIQSVSDWDQFFQFYSEKMNYFSREIQDQSYLTALTNLTIRMRAYFETPFSNIPGDIQDKAVSDLTDIVNKWTKWSTPGLHQNVFKAEGKKRFDQLKEVDTPSNRKTFQSILSKQFHDQRALFGLSGLVDVETSTSKKGMKKIVESGVNAAVGSLQEKVGLEKSVIAGDVKEEIVDQKVQSKIDQSFNSKLSIDDQRKWSTVLGKIGSEPLGSPLHVDVLLKHFVDTLHAVFPFSFSNMRVVHEDNLKPYYLKIAKGMFSIAPYAADQFLMIVDDPTQSNLEKQHRLALLMVEQFVQYCKRRDFTQDKFKQYEIDYARFDNALNPDRDETISFPKIIFFDAFKLCTEACVLTEDDRKRKELKDFGANEIVMHAPSKMVDRTVKTEPEKYGVRLVDANEMVRLIPRGVDSHGLLRKAGVDTQSSSSSATVTTSASAALSYSDVEQALLPRLKQNPYEFSFELSEDFVKTRKRAMGGAKKPIAPSSVSVIPVRGRDTGTKKLQSLTVDIEPFQAILKHISNQIEDGIKNRSSLVVGTALSLVESMSPQEMKHFSEFKKEIDAYLNEMENISTHQMNVIRLAAILSKMTQSMARDIDPKFLRLFTQFDPEQTDSVAEAASKTKHRRKNFLAPVVIEDVAKLHALLAPHLDQAKTMRIPIKAADKTAFHQYHLTIRTQRALKKVKLNKIDWEKQAGQLIKRFLNKAFSPKSDDLYLLCNQFVNNVPLNPESWKAFLNGGLKDEFSLFIAGTADLVYLTKMELFVREIERLYDDSFIQHTVPIADVKSFVSSALDQIAQQKKYAELLYSEGAPASSSTRSTSSSDSDGMKSVVADKKFKDKLAFEMKSQFQLLSNYYPVSDYLDASALESSSSTAIGQTAGQAAAYGFKKLFGFLSKQAPVFIDEIVKRVGKVVVKGVHAKVDKALAGAARIKQPKELENQWKEIICSDVLDFDQLSKTFVDQLYKVFPDTFNRILFRIMDSNAVEQVRRAMVEMSLMFLPLFSDQFKAVLDQSGGKLGRKENEQLALIMVEAFVFGCEHRLFFQDVIQQFNVPFEYFIAPPGGKAVGLENFYSIIAGCAKVVKASKNEVLVCGGLSHVENKSIDTFPEKYGYRFASNEGFSEVEQAYVENHSNNHRLKQFVSSERFHKKFSEFDNPYRDFDGDLNQNVFKKQDFGSGLVLNFQLPQGAKQSSIKNQIEVILKDLFDYVELAIEASKNRTVFKSAAFGDFTSSEVKTLHAIKCILQGASGASRKPFKLEEILLLIARMEKLWIHERGAKDIENEMKLQQFSHAEHVSHVVEIQKKLKKGAASITARGECFAEISKCFDEARLYLVQQYFTVEKSSVMIPSLMSDNQLMLRKARLRHAFSDLMHTEKAMTTELKDAVSHLRFSSGRWLADIANGAVENLVLDGGQNGEQWKKFIKKYYKQMSLFIQNSNDPTYLKIVNNFNQELIDLYKDPFIKHNIPTAEAELAAIRSQLRIKLANMDSRSSFSVLDQHAARDFSFMPRLMTKESTKNHFKEHMKKELLVLPKLIHLKQASVKMKQGTMVRESKSLAENIVSGIAEKGLNVISKAVPMASDVKDVIGDAPKTAGKIIGEKLGSAAGALASRYFDVMPTDKDVGDLAAWFEKHENEVSLDGLANAFVDQLYAVFPDTFNRIIVDQRGKNELIEKMVSLTIRMSSFFKEEFEAALQQTQFMDEKVRYQALGLVMVEAFISACQHRHLFSGWFKDWKVLFDYFVKAPNKWLNPEVDVFQVFAGSGLLAQATERQIKEGFIGPGEKWMCFVPTSEQSGVGASPERFGLHFTSADSFATKEEFQIGALPLVPSSSSSFSSSLRGELVSLSWTDSDIAKIDQTFSQFVNPYEQLRLAMTSAPTSTAAQPSVLPSSIFSSTQPQPQQPHPQPGWKPGT